MRYISLFVFVFFVSAFTDAQAQNDPQPSSSFAKSGIKISDEPWGENLPVKQSSPKPSGVSKKTQMVVDKKGQMRMKVDGKVIKPTPQSSTQSSSVKPTDQYQPFFPIKNK